MMTKLFQNRYVSLILAYGISFGGLILYDWNLSQVLFYLFFAHLIKVPSYIMINYFLNDSNLKKTIGFIVIFGFIFAGYALFYILLIESVAPKYDYLYRENSSTFINELALFTGRYALPLLGLFLIEFLQYWFKIRPLKNQKPKENRLLFKLIVYYGSHVPIIILASVTQSNEFDLSQLQAAVIVLSLMFLADLYWCGFRGLLDFELKE